VLARHHHIGIDEIKSLHVNMLVDTRGDYMCINETIKQQLDLPVLEKRKGVLANGSVVEYDVVGPIEVRSENRRCSVDAVVIPGDNEPLLGAIPMEDMDVFSQKTVNCEPRTPLLRTNEDKVMLYYLY
jgi:predicted aspartyl protease